MLVFALLSRRTDTILGNSRGTALHAETRSLTIEQVRCETSLNSCDTLVDIDQIHTVVTVILHFRRRRIVYSVSITSQMTTSEVVVVVLAPDQRHNHSGKQMFGRSR